jgi:hypothetical protein
MNSSILQDNETASIHQLSHLIQRYNSVQGYNEHNYTSKQLEERRNEIISASNLPNQFLYSNPNDFNEIQAVTRQLQEISVKNNEISCLQQEIYAYMLSYSPMLVRMKFVLCSRWLRFHFNYTKHVTVARNNNYYSNNAIESQYKQFTEDNQFFCRLANSFNQSVRNVEQEYDNLQLSLASLANNIANKQDLINMQDCVSYLQYTVPCNSSSKALQRYRAQLALIQSKSALQILHRAKELNKDINLLDRPIQPPKRNNSSSLHAALNDLKNCLQPNSYHFNLPMLVLRAVDLEFELNLLDYNTYTQTISTTDKQVILNTLLRVFSTKFEQLQTHNIAHNPNTRRLKYKIKQFRRINRNPRNLRLQAKLAANPSPDEQLANELAFVDSADSSYVKHRLAAQSQNYNNNLNQMLNDSQTNLTNSLKGDLASLHDQLNTIHIIQHRSEANNTADSLSSITQNDISAPQIIRLPVKDIHLLYVLRYLRLKELKNRLLSYSNYYVSLERGLILDYLTFPKEDKFLFTSEQLINTTHNVINQPIRATPETEFSSLYSDVSSYPHDSAEFMKFIGISRREDSYQFSPPYNATGNNMHLNAGKNSPELDCNVLVLDSAGEEIVYDKAIEDYKAIENELLQLGSFYIQQHRKREGKDNGPCVDVVDRFSLLQDLFECEVKFQLEKIRALEIWLEILQHSLQAEECRQIINNVQQLIALRPYIDIEAANSENYGSIGFSRYFTQSYNLHIKQLAAQTLLLRNILTAQMERERVEMRKLRKKEWRGCLANKQDDSKAFAAVEEMFLPDTNSPFCGSYRSGLLHFFPSITQLMHIYDHYNSTANNIFTAECGDYFYLCGSISTLEQYNASWNEVQAEKSAQLYTLSPHKDILLQLQGCQYFNSPAAAIRAIQHGQSSDSNNFLLNRLQSSVAVNLFEALKLSNKLLDAVYESALLTKLYKQQAEAIGLNSMQLVNNNNIKSFALSIADCSGCLPMSLDDFSHIEQYLTLDITPLQLHQTVNPLPAAGATQSNHPVATGTSNNTLSVPSEDEDLDISSLTSHFRRRSVELESLARERAADQLLRQEQLAQQQQLIIDSLERNTALQAEEPTELAELWLNTFRAIVLAQATHTQALALTTKFHSTLILCSQDGSHRHLSIQLRSKDGGIETQQLHGGNVKSIPSATVNHPPVHNSLLNEMTFINLMRLKQPLYNVMLSSMAKNRIEIIQNLKLNEGKDPAAAEREIIDTAASIQLQSFRSSVDEASFILRLKREENRSNTIFFQHYCQQFISKFSVYSYLVEYVKIEKELKEFHGRVLAAASPFHCVAQESSLQLLELLPHLNKHSNEKVASNDCLPLSGSSSLFYLPRINCLLGLLHDDRQQAISISALANDLQCRRLLVDILHISLCSTQLQNLNQFQQTLLPTILPNSLFTSHINNAKNIPLQVLFDQFSPLTAQQTKQLSNDLTQHILIHSNVEPAFNHAAEDQELLAAANTAQGFSAVYWNQLIHLLHSKRNVSLAKLQLILSNQLHSNQTANTVHKEVSLTAHQFLANSDGEAFQGHPIKTKMSEICMYTLANHDHKLSGAYSHQCKTINYLFHNAAINAYYHNLNTATTDENGITLIQSNGNRSAEEEKLIHSALNTSQTFKLYLLIKSKPRVVYNALLDNRISLQLDDLVEDINWRDWIELYRIEILSQLPLQLTSNTNRAVPNIRILSLWQSLRVSVLPNRNSRKYVKHCQALEKELKASNQFEQFVEYCNQTKGKSLSEHGSFNEYFLSLDFIALTAQFKALTQLINTQLIRLQHSYLSKQLNQQLNLNQSQYTDSNIMMKAHSDLDSYAYSLPQAVQYIKQSRAPQDSIILGNSELRVAFNNLYHKLATQPTAEGLFLEKNSDGLSLHKQLHSDLIQSYLKQTQSNLFVESLNHQLANNVDINFNDESRIMLDQVVQSKEQRFQSNIDKELRHNQQAIEWQSNANSSLATLSTQLAHLKRESASIEHKSQTELNNCIAGLYSQLISNKLDFSAIDNSQASSNHFIVQQFDEIHTLIKANKQSIERIKDSFLQDSEMNLTNCVQLAQHHQNTKEEVIQLEEDLLTEYSNNLIVSDDWEEVLTDQMSAAFAQTQLKHQLLTIHNEKRQLLHEKYQNNKQIKQLKDDEKELSTQYNVAMVTSPPPPRAHTSAVPPLNNFQNNSSQSAEHEIVHQSNHLNSILQQKKQEKLSLLAELQRISSPSVPAFLNDFQWRAALTQDDLSNKQDIIDKITHENNLLREYLAKSSNSPSSLSILLK